MLRNFWVFFLILFLSTFAQAKLTVHIQSPWRNDAAHSGDFLYVLGGATGYSTSPEFRMTVEGDGWFSYTWDKVASDYTWEDFGIRGCPDMNSCMTSVTWQIGGSEMKFTMKTLFETESELWIYTDADSYTISLTPPGAKVVWFKSPWGNRALPQMIFGQDSVLMHFSQDDESTCGWFAGAISPAMMKSNVTKSAYFVRYNAPYLAVPEKDVIDLAEALSSADTIFVDGTSAVPTISTTIGTLGQCFDSTRTLHVYHPWRTNSTYKDSAVYISVGAEIVNNVTAMKSDEGFPYWYHYDFPMSIKKDNWNNCEVYGALVNFYSSSNQGKRYWTNDKNRPCISTLFPKGVYETWIFTNSNGNIEAIYAPLEFKVIRLLSPWDNMSPMMLVDEDTLKMGPISKDTCGWYQALSFKHEIFWDVMFREAFGFEHYTSKGLTDGDPISLDSMISLYDTVWIYPYTTSGSAPKISNTYPKRLGICPSMKISALVVDWAGEGFDDAIDVDFGNIYYGNDYTKVTYKDSTGKLATNKTCQSAWHPDGSYTPGMVQDTLVNGNPARVDSSVYPWYECSAAREIEKWFVPVVVAKDSKGKEYTNGVCRDIDLTLDEEGFWLADISEAHEDGGFFPIDDLEYLDSAKTVKNPKFDQSLQHQAGGKIHNYSFSMKISAQFQYVKGQYFEFRGDDDVWVFINNHLVVDIGGCHGPSESFVDLDTIGQNDPKLKLQEGVEYPFHIFFSERNAAGSNFKMRTSINLRTQKTYYTEAVPSSTGIISYNLMQMLVDESLSCDVTSVSKVEKKAAQSLFVLQGGALPAEGDTLLPGMNYGGIYINENMAGFSIDTSEIVRNRALPSGKYALYCLLASDLSQYQIISFEVPEYPLPDIAFVNVFEEKDDTLLVLDPTGLNLRGQRLGEDGGKNDTMLAHVTYPEGTPLKVAVLYVGSLCKDCIVPMNFETNDSLTFLDSKGQVVTSITSDSTGYASFYVVGETSLIDASFRITSEFASNDLEWNNLHFKEPPVPFVVHAQMHDMNGDGIPDSLFIPFSKPFNGVVPDTLAWSFGDPTFHPTNGVENIQPLVFKDSILVLKDSRGLLKNVFTGSNDEIYSGSIKYHYTYLDEDTGDSVKLGMNASIEDHVGPVLIGATLTPISEDLSTITVNVSEGTVTKILDGALLFEVYRDTNNISDSLQFFGVSKNNKGNILKVSFSRSSYGYLPALGDSIRLVPGSLADLSGNVAHFGNPKVRVKGKQLLELKVPGVVTLRNFADAWTEKDQIMPIVVSTNKPVQSIADSLGLPGVMLNFNIGEVATDKMLNLSSSANRDSALAEVRVDYENYYFTHLGGFVAKKSGTIRCNDAKVFYNELSPERSNCYDNQGNLYFEWSGRSEKGRIMGTGAYITKMKLKVRSGKETIGETNKTYTIGVRRTN